MKKLFSLLFALSLALSLTVTAAAGGTRVVDELGLLSEDQRQSLEEQIFVLSGTYDFDVVLLTTDELQGKSAAAYADDFYDSGGYGRGPERDGILFLVSLGQRDWAISTCGYGIQAFTNYGNDYIAERVIPLLSDGDYYQAFSTFLSLSEKFLQQAQTGRPYDVGHPVKSEGNVALKVILCIFAALAVAAIATLVMKSQLNNARPQPMAHSYISNFDLRVQRDIFLYSRVSRIRRVQNSGGGGGSSTHISSGGVRHGGSSGKF